MHPACAIRELLFTMWHTNHWPGRKTFSSASQYVIINFVEYLVKITTNPMCQAAECNFIRGFLVVILLWFLSSVILITLLSTWAFLHVLQPYATPLDFFFGFRRICSRCGITWYEIYYRLQRRRAFGGVCGWADTVVLVLNIPVPRCLDETWQRCL